MKIIKKGKMKMMAKVTLGIQVWLITIKNTRKKILQCLKNLRSHNQILWEVRRLA